MRNTVLNFKKRSTFMLILLGFLKGLLRAIPAFFIGLLFMGVLDHWLEFTGVVRQIIWSLNVLISLIFLSSGFLPLSLFSVIERSKNIHKRNPSEFRVDELRIMLDLSSTKAKEGVSDELRMESLNSRLGKLNHLPLSWAFPEQNWKKNSLVAFLALFISTSLFAFFSAPLGLSPRVLFPFSSDKFSSMVKVRPGDATVSWGGEIQIEIEMLQRSPIKPELLLKVGEQWLKLDPQVDGEKIRSYVLKNIVTPTIYRVRWKGEESRKFVITPKHPIAIDHFLVSINPPAYVKKEKIQKETPHIAGLAGSQVRLEARMNENFSEAQIKFSDGKVLPFPKTSSNMGAIEFILEKTLTYQFLIRRDKGDDFISTQEYPIDVTVDAPPSITMLSPSEDLVVGEKEKLPITYEAKDDEGLWEIILEWVREGVGNQKKTISTFNSPKDSVLSTFDWELANEKLKPGEVFRFRIQAVDRNTITGPGVAVTPWRVIEIQSFEKSHDLTEKLLQEWRDKALDMLADLNSIKSSLQKDPPSMEKNQAQFDQAAQKSKALEAAMKKIVSMMENDPLADYGVCLEHKSISENLEAMNESAIPQTKAAFQTKNKDEALNQVQQMSMNMEQMMSLSEELSKNQNEKDVMESAEQFAENGEDLADKLDKLSDAKGELKNELQKEIERTLAEAMENLQKLASSLQKNPKELPEDFVNQEALKDVNLSKPQDILSQISELMKKGDFQKAKELAQEFLKMSKRLQSQLKKAHDSYSKSSSASELEKQIGEQKENLNKIIDEQQQLLSKTQTIESKRMEAVFQEQENKLKHLLEKQEETVRLTEQLLQKSDLPLAVGQIYRGLPYPMRIVVEEFKKGRVKDSPANLKGILIQTGLVLNYYQAQTTSPYHAESQIIDKNEKEILSELSNLTEPKSTYSAEEKNTLKDLESKQSALSTKTKELKKNIQMLSRKTASLQFSVPNSVGDAAGEMDKAKESLGNQSSKAAQSAQEKALQHLREGQDGLEQAQSMMQQMQSGDGMMSGEDGSPGPGSGKKIKVMRRSQGSGGKGTNIDKVRLPKAEDFKPPKAFREDLMEALKEKYPKTYEEIIQKYYRKLSQ